MLVIAAESACSVSTDVPASSGHTAYDDVELVVGDEVGCDDVRRASTTTGGQTAVGDASFSQARDFVAAEAARRSSRARPVGSQRGSRSQRASRTRREPRIQRVRASSAGDRERGRRSITRFRGRVVVTRRSTTPNSRARGVTRPRGLGTFHAIRLQTRWVRGRHLGGCEVMGMTDRDFVVHRNPVWRGRADFVIRADIEVQDSPRRFEQLWAQQLEEERFEICCIPFFVYDLALGDEVETDSKYLIRTVLRASGVRPFGCGLASRGTARIARRWSILCVVRAASLSRTPTTSSESRLTMSVLKTWPTSFTSVKHWANSPTRQGGRSDVSNGGYAVSQLLRSRVSGVGRPLGGCRKLCADLEFGVPAGSRWAAPESRTD